jgi:hypothetical protein
MGHYNTKKLSKSNLIFFGFDQITTVYVFDIYRYLITIYNQRHSVRRPLLTSFNAKDSSQQHNDWNQKKSKTTFILKDESCA